MGMKGQTYKVTLNKDTNLVCNRVPKSPAEAKDEGFTAW